MEKDNLKEIADQLRSSAEWLEREASEEKDYNKKSQLLKEATAARRELDATNKKLKD